MRKPIMIHALFLMIAPIPINLTAVRPISSGYRPTLALNPLAISAAVLTLLFKKQRKWVYPLLFPAVVAVLPQHFLYDY